MTARLTPAQRRVLSAAARHVFGRVVGGSAQMREQLAARGLIEADGYHSGQMFAGPLFKITEAGRQAVSSEED